MIDDVIERVNSLLTPFEELDYSPFDRTHADDWEQVKAHFRVNVVTIEDEAKYFIDASFKMLRSAEAAFDMLRNFEHIRSRQTINERLMKKYDDILDKFVEEVNVLDRLFEQHKSKPPISKNQPPIAGAIRWARSLFLKAKATILKFQT